MTTKSNRDAETTDTTPEPGQDGGSAPAKADASPLSKATTTPERDEATAADTAGTGKDAGPSAGAGKDGAHAGATDHANDEADATGEAHAADADDADADDTDGTDDAAAHGAAAGVRTGGGFAGGAAAVVSGGLGLVSLTGTGLSDMLRSRQEIIGQIETSSGGSSDQVDAFYGAPWHTAALVNGIFALLAILIGVVLLTLLAQRAEARSWVKAVALGGLILGLVGLLVSVGMYFDLFAGQPELPAAPQAP